MSDPWPPEDDVTRALRDALRATADDVIPESRLDALHGAVADQPAADSADGADSRTGRPRYRWLGVAAAAVLVAGVGVPVGVRLWSGAGGGSATSGAAQDTGAESAASPSAAPSAPTLTPSSPAAWAFVTADASVVCLLDAGGATCELRVEPAFDPVGCPPDARLSAEVSSGSVAEANCTTGTGMDELATNPTHTGWHTPGMPTVTLPQLEAEAAVLPDGVPLTVGTTTCRVTASAVTCTVAGAGFTLSRTGFTRV